MKVSWKDQERMRIYTWHGTGIKRASMRLSTIKKTEKLVWSSTHMKLSNGNYLEDKMIGKKTAGRPRVILLDWM